MKNISKKNLKRNSDEDELLQNLRILTFKREKVSEEVLAKKNDCDRLMELLLCSTHEDVDIIIEEIFPIESVEVEKFRMSTNENKILLDRILLIEKFKMQKILGIGIRTCHDKSILSQYTHVAENEESESYMIMFRRDSNFKLKLKHIVIPDFDEVKILEDTLLNEDVPSYMYLIQQCLFSFWTKGLAIKSLKNEKRVDKSKIYCNKTRTFISFLFQFYDCFYAEYKLQYDLISLYPYEVKYRILCNREFGDSVTRRLEELKTTLLSTSIEKAILHYLNKEASSDIATSSSSSSSSPSITQPPLFLE